ncbi:hypothetical protein D7V97_39435 [Corallococcus sp. CA053C]|uniref:hypothetical protein n=1 Tax=Corallococcus sp. CA053C TaxID=2316732 RepID=UPI000EA1154E|nr:hypothetical protein [Corallococcus sp. CA053C]RKG94135.1 hypothetical protein D7V97_39435 [Corallococcus sp. CA053C]
MKKSLTLTAVLAVVLTAPVDLAQSSTGAGSSILDALLTPTNVGIALGVVASGVGLFFGGTWLTTRRKRIVATVAFHAFHVVEDIAALDESENGFDKAARGLEVADSWMKANGWRPLKPWEQAAVKLEFKSLHGAQSAEVKVRAEAMELALGAIGSAAALAPAVEVASGPSMPRG